MRKLPVFVLAAATALTVAGVPMTAQAATCPLSSGSYSSSSCFGQSGKTNSVLNKLGCSSNGFSRNNGKVCITGSNGTKGSAYSGSSCNKSSNSFSKAAGANNSRQCNTRSWR